MSNSNEQLQVTFVTGGGNGIGAAVCEAFAARGDTVVVADISPEDAAGTVARIRAAGGNASAAHIDITDRDSIKAGFEKVVEEHGGFDALVNIAGAWLRPKSVGFRAFADIGPDEWRWVTDVNLDGTYNMCHLGIPVLAERGGGAIVNMSSATFFMGTPGLAHYVAAKAGIMGLTRVLAREVGPLGIRVNAVAPGAILTDTDPSDDVVAFHSEKAQNRGIRRIATADDVAGPVLFFASSASQFVSGQTLVIDGGVVMH
jgi:3-oxoacyl-[acyl-carrier protein] reductase